MWKAMSSRARGSIGVYAASDGVTTALPAVLLAAALAVLASWTSPVRAAPVPEAERIPVDLRRTTLVVRDIDKSLPLYRDALGLKLIYDEKIGPGPDEQGRPRPPSVRLVLLRANDDFVGVLGLMQRLQGEPAPAPIPCWKSASNEGLSGNSARGCGNGVLPRARRTALGDSQNWIALLSMSSLSLSVCESKPANSNRNCGQAS